MSHLRIKSLFPKSLRQGMGRFFDRTVAKLPMAARVRLKFYKSHGFLPRLSNPRTFSEKITYIKFCELDLTNYVDKIKAKETARAIVGSEHIIPTLYSGESLPPHDLRAWRLPYVVKVNNGSGGNIFVRETPDHSRIDRDVERFLSYDFSRVSDERFYAKIEPKVFVEPFIAVGDELPKDYKFFVFDGRVHMVDIHTDRENRHKRTFFSRDFEALPIRLGYDTDAENIEKPEDFDKMVILAEKLGKGFGFVRVDLYNIDGDIFFGEFTFTPASGLQRFDPPSTDDELGKLWPWPDPALARLSATRGAA